MNQGTAGIYFSGIAFASVMCASFWLVSLWFEEMPAWVYGVWWVWALGNAHGRAYERSASEL